MPASDITHLPIADIIIETRLRPASATGVASIVTSLLEAGKLLQPLIVRKIKGSYRLLDGLHRLEAVKQLEWIEVPVRIEICTNNEAVRIEVQANTARAPLTALDMAVFLAAQKALYEKEHPETAHGKAGAAGRWNASDIMSAASYSANAAEVFGKSDRHIQRLIKVGEQLDQKHIDLLRNAPKRVQFSDLEQIAKCSNPIDRVDICEALHHGTAKSAKEVLARRKQPGVATQSPVEQAQSKITDAWTRAPKEARRRFVAAYLDELRALIGDPETETAAPADNTTNADEAADHAGVINFQSRREMS